MSPARSLAGRGRLPLAGAGRRLAPLARQRGAALLAAMLTVTLVASFAAASLWRQYRTVEVEAAERSRIQSAWILTGALDWARLILREDGAGSGVLVDHLAEPWAVPLQEARLSTFLAADRSNTQDTEAEETFLAGQIIDMQSLLNVNSLVQGNEVNDTVLRAFSRLFELLGLPQAQLATLAENLRFARDVSPDNRSGSQAPLLPQTVEQLTWLGLPVQTVAVLQPYVTVIPVTAITSLNLNTAPAECIYAAIPGISLADAQRVVALREAQHFSSVDDAKARAGLGHVENMAALHLDVKSGFFEVHGRLRLGEATIEERSLVQRAGRNVTVLRRERGMLDPTALTQAAQQQPPVR